MPVARIKDIAEVMIEILAPRHGHDPDGIRIEVMGTKPGEKMYEELMNTEETRRAIELKNYFVVVPAFTSIYRQVDYTYPDVVSKNVTNPYNSSNEEALSPADLKNFLLENNLLDQEIPVRENQGERYFP